MNEYDSFIRISKEEKRREWELRIIKDSMSSKCECGKKIVMKPDEEFRICKRCGRMVRNSSRMRFKKIMKEKLGI